MKKEDLSKLLITKCLSAYKTTTKPNASSVRKNRDSWGIAIKINNKTEYKCNQKTYISNDKNIILLPKGSDYEWKSFGGECLMINFDANLTSKEILSFKVNNSLSIISFYKSIIQNNFNNSDFSDMQNIKTLYEFILYLIKGETNSYLTKTQINILNPVVEYINDNYNLPDISLNSLGEISGVSTVYFRKLFKKHFGLSPIDYLQTLRINKAKEILKSDYDSVESVALSVGYNSLYHFSKTFKKLVGVSPSVFAKKKSH